MEKEFYFTLATKLSTLRDFPEGVVTIPRDHCFFEQTRSMGKSTDLHYCVKCIVKDDHNQYQEAIDFIEKGFHILVMNDNGVVAGILTKDQPIESMTFGSFQWTPDIMRKLEANPELDVEVVTRKHHSNIPALAVNHKEHVNIPVGLKYQDGVYNSGNGRIYPKGGLDNAFKELEEKGAVPLMYGGKMVGEVSSDGKVFNIADDVKVAIDCGDDASFSIRATIKEGKIVDVTGWNLIDVSTSNKDEADFQRTFTNNWGEDTKSPEIVEEFEVAFSAIEQTGPDIDNFSTNYLAANKPIKLLETFKAENYLLIDKHGALIGYVDRSAYVKMELGRGLTHPSMQCDYDGYIVGCHGGKAFLDYEPILEDVDGVIGITRHSSGIIAWIVNPKIRDGSLTGSAPVPPVDPTIYKAFIIMLNSGIQDYLKRTS